MTSPDDLFFHALQQEPDDDLTRLAYADALEEMGGGAAAARAELIRVQVELAALPLLTREAHLRAAELTDRQDRLLDRWEREWIGEWADVLGGWAFRRGLVEAVRADASAFLEHAGEWFARWPTLAVVQLRRAAARLPELAASPWLAHLRGLEMRCNGIGANSLRRLTESRYLGQLQALDLSHNAIGRDGAAMLAEAPFADALSELHLAGCGLGLGQLGRLLGGRGRQWRRLDLAQNQLDRADLAALAGSPVLRNLTALDLAWNSPAIDGVAELVSSPNAAGLVDLGLCGVAWPGGVAALTASPHLSNLRSLDLRHGRWRDQDGLAALSRSPLLGGLRRLLLAPTAHSNGWVDDVLQVARPPRRPEVRRGDCAAKPLLRSEFLTPTQLIECDLEELWLLGDRRDTPPTRWDGS
jgi:uncharacterized protein (TIGR02996 family)